MKKHEDSDENARSRAVALARGFLMIFGGVWIVLGIAMLMAEWGNPIWSSLAVIGIGVLCWLYALLGSATGIVVTLVTLFFALFSP